jgi:hypothetical protein
MEITNAAWVSAIDEIEEGYVLLLNGANVFYGNLDNLKTKVSDCVQLFDATVEDFEIYHIQKMAAQIEVTRTLNLYDNRVNETENTINETYTISVQGFCEYKEDTREAMMKTVTRILNDKSVRDVSTEDVEVVRTVEYDVRYAPTEHYAVEVQFPPKPVVVNYEHMSLEELVKLQAHINALVLQKMTE